MIDYTNFTIIASEEASNVIVIRLGFNDNEILVIEPESWPVDLDSFCLDMVRSLRDPSYEHHTLGTPEKEGDL
jgi:hypothetical protein